MRWGAAAGGTNPARNEVPLRSCRATRNVGRPYTILQRLTAITYKLAMTHVGGCALSTLTACGLPARTTIVTR
ncbi:hypothetical protein E2C01_102483 [Portunus trituberculatus]|uniref:Uncharacterized protein n=1 Tax=Portunus trituberculatus TaxID=210409 RepID=A0A5B7KMY1_PORTR|nr:hypothetical protein [Portunus trituberculatus]